MSGRLASRTRARTEAKTEEFTWQSPPPVTKSLRTRNQATIGSAEQITSTAQHDQGLAQSNRQEELGNGPFRTRIMNLLTAIMTTFFGWIATMKRFVIHVLNPRRAAQVELQLENTFEKVERSPGGGLCEVELCFPQLRKQFHIQEVHFARLIDILFESNSQQTNPLNPKETSVLSSAVFDSHYRRKYPEDAVPQFSSDLKLFFSVNSIDGGRWVQFSGPGSLFKDSQCEVLLGSFCDPETRGNFTSGHFNSTPGARVARCTSQWTVSIKWETSSPTLGQKWF